MDRQIDDEWGDPYEFEGEEETHLKEWESVLPAQLLAESHEALSKLYHKSTKRSHKNAEKRSKGWQ